MGRLELAGDAQPIAESIAFDAFSASTNGVLVYLSGVGSGLLQLRGSTRRGSLTVRWGKG